MEPARGPLKKKVIFQDPGPPERQRVPINHQVNGSVEWFAQKEQGTLRHVPFGFLLVIYLNKTGYVEFLLGFSSGSIYKYLGKWICGIQVNVAVGQNQ